jgi:CYTH domain-containing protein
MLRHSRGRELTKRRFHIPYDTVTFEVDVFSDQLEPLIIIEVELNTPNQPLSLPEWVGEEITNRGEYSNAALACDGIPRHFKQWL